jgi:nucleotide-binding universal stress UspA family protein
LAGDAVTTAGSSPSAAACVVVGFDGSTHAREALVHAVRRVPANGDLVVVYAYGAVPEQSGRLRSAQVLEENERLGREVLEGMRSDCGELLAGVRYHTELVPMPPAQALVDAARIRQATEIVVGTRGFGDTRTWLGSVSHELLRIADRPVTVVPPAERIGA